MNYSLPADLWSSVIPLSLAIGAVGGLVWDIGYAIRQSRKNPQTGIDNIIALPSVHGPRARPTIDLGFLGPMAIGAVTGVLAVLLVGPSAPGAEEAAKAVTTVSEVAPGSPAVAANATAAAEDDLTTKLDATTLVVLAILGGFGGWGLLQALAAKTSAFVEAAIGKAYAPASAAGAEAVEKKAKDMELTDDQQRQLGAVAKKGFETAARTALQPDGASTSGG